MDCRLDAHYQWVVFLVWAFSNPLHFKFLTLVRITTVKKGGLNQWIIMVKVILQLLKIHLALLIKSSQAEGDV